MQSYSDFHGYFNFAKIITVTVNTAIDYILEVNNLSLGDTALAENSHKFAAGKGINVAKAVASLECSVQAFGFVGTQSLALFQRLSSELISIDFTQVKGEARTNVTLFDKQTLQQTHIRTSGFTVTATDCQNLLNNLIEVVQKDDIVVLSGSLPNGVPPDFYKTLISACHASEAIVFLDSSGEALKQGVQAKPYLIKPNQREFETLAGRRFETEQDMIAAAWEIIANGVEWVVISRAEQGAIMIGRDFFFKASVKLDRQDKLISHIGCGDAMLAGLAVAKLHNYSAEAGLKLAVACGAANLFSHEPGCFSQQILANILEKMKIQAL